MKFFQQMSQVRLVLIVAAFITLTGNFTFFEKVVQVYPLSQNALFVASLFVWLFVFLSALLLLICFRYSAKAILITLLMISSVIGYAINNYGIVVDVNMISNVFETNPDESFDLVSYKLIPYLFFLGVLPSIFVWRIELLTASMRNQLWLRAQVFIGLVLIFVLVTLSFSKHYTSFARENRDLRLYINPSYTLYAFGKYVNTKFDTASEPFVQIGLDATINAQDNSKRLVILVLGETARADRFSLNGYERKTNPFLEQESVITFSNMTSCGTDTALSVPCMFSHLTREQYSHAKGKNMSNVLDVINHAGVEVLWRDNNSDSKGVADRIDFEDFRDENKNPICDPECRDEGMLIGLQDYINERSEKDILVVLHTMGSHGPAYHKRYPEAFEVFTPACLTNQLNECSDKQINNAYDNTIVYADYVMAKTLELLKNNASDRDTAMFYISDHGESLGEKGVYLHGMPYFMAPQEQIHVPAIMWFDKRFGEAVNAEALGSTVNLTLSHDNLFHTLLGMMRVSTNVYDQNLDILVGK